MGFGSFLKKSTGVDYLKGDAKITSTTTQQVASKKTKTSSKQDDKFAKSVEQSLKKINDQIEDLLEKLRVRRSL